MEIARALGADLDPRVLSVYRIMLGLLLLEHGTSKILGWPEHVGFPQPPVLSLVWFAGVIEIVGALMILGLLTRPTAFVLSGFLAVAYFMQHAPQAFFPMNNHGEDAILYCFAFFFIAVAGPGAWSIDGLIKASGRASKSLGQPWPKPFRS